MKRVVASCLFVFTLLLGGILIGSQPSGAEKKGDYLLPGNVKEGWKVFATKKCNLCHSIWGEGGKGGPDLGTLPESYVSQAQLAALMWNHGPEMLDRMRKARVTWQKIEGLEMVDLMEYLNRGIP